MSNVKLKFMALVGAFFLSAPLWAQSEVSMKPIIDQIQQHVDNLQQMGKQIDRVEFDLVHSSADKKSFRDLISGRHYRVLTFGDNNRITTMKVSVMVKQNNQWVTINSNQSDINLAQVDFVADQSAMYQVVISAPGFKGSYTASHYAMIIYHD